MSFLFSAFALLPAAFAELEFSPPPQPESKRRPGAITRCCSWIIHPHHTHPPRASVRSSFHFPCVWPFQLAIDDDSFVGVCGLESFWPRRRLLPIKSNRPLSEWLWRARGGEATTQHRSKPLHHYTRTPKARREAAAAAAAARRRRGRRQQQQHSQGLEEGCSTTSRFVIIISSRGSSHIPKPASCGAVELFGGQQQGGSRGRATWDDAGIDGRAASSSRRRRRQQQQVEEEEEEAAAAGMGPDGAWPRRPAMDWGAGRGGSRWIDWG